MNIIDKYEARSKNANSLVCVGLDADLEKLPEEFKKKSEPQFAFNQYIIEETHKFVAAFKPNIAFYEARGDQGLRELKFTMDYLQEKHPDIFTICDAKRADIGNTNRGYVTELFDWFGFDAVTVSPYLGREAVKPFLDRKDKASIILCRTSNPGSGEFQDLDVGGLPLWEKVARRVAKEWNQNNNCMLVVGATYPEEMKKIRAVAPSVHFLVPGIGAQGGDLKSVLEAGLRREGGGLIINSGRDIIFSDNPRKAAQTLRDQINTMRS